MNNFVTLATFTYPHEYAVLKLLLEQKHVRFYFQNETIIGLVPFHSNAFGGIFLKVHPEDVECAQKIMDRFDKKPHLKIV